MKILELLQSFCSKEPGSHVAHPFSAGDHVFFTDRVVILRVPNQHSRTNPNESHVSAAAALRLFDNALTVARFDPPPPLPGPEFDPPSQERIIVPVVWHHWLLSDVMLGRLAQLPRFVLGVPLAKAGKRDPVPFRFDAFGTRDGAGLLMPILPKTTITTNVLQTN